MTVSIVGFCSGTGDLLWVFRELKKINLSHTLVVKYLNVLVRVDGTDDTRGLGSAFVSDVKAAARDPQWIEAVWRGIMYFYWTPAMKFASKIGAKSAIAKGFFYDTALNHGAEDLDQFLGRTKAKTPVNGGNEVEWLKDFINVREYDITVLDPSTNNGQPDRTRLWRSILLTGNTSLQRPLNDLVCYGDRFVIV